MYSHEIEGLFMGTQYHPSLYPRGNEVKNATGTITGNSFTDGIATLTGGMLSDLILPLSDTDATNKLYVDNLSFGIKWKQPVRLATTSSDGNLDLSTGGLLTIDGKVTVASDRILVKNQSNSI